ncbi:sulfotransferase family 2 domain-containing protein [Paraglaciecola marina]|uniref:sulfotransferase family 2 domain-containing protein n=1 Tax=Paraglaciecola marina TaxID=2500157 RepID=UPI00105C3A27|nr:sulfotransferase family 2 domain-containing protein [Paraglaciecola marina]
MTWLSHHIPKTAGTSLKLGYASAFGNNAVKYLYAPDEVKVIGRGESIRLPYGTRILHGHFHAHPEQIELYPNAKRIVWVRDPVERAWSLLGHLLAVQKSKEEFQIIYKEFGENIEKNKLDVFEFFLTHPRLQILNRPYQNHFSKVPINDFHFVGRTHCYTEDLQRLSQLMGAEIPLLEKNVRSSGKGLPKNRGSYQELLVKEYEIVDDFL